MSGLGHHQCCATVESLALRKRMQKAVGHNGVFTERDYHRCPSKAKVCRDGKWYCGMHDPIAVAERDRKREERKRERQTMNHFPRNRGEDLRVLSEFYRNEIAKQQSSIDWLADKISEACGLSPAYWKAEAKRRAVAAGEE